MLSRKRIFCLLISALLAGLVVGLGGWPQKTSVFPGKGLANEDQDSQLFHFIKGLANEDQDSQLFHFIIEQNYISWKKLSDVSYTFEYNYEFTDLDYSSYDPATKGLVKGEGIGRIIKKGSWLWSSIQDSKKWINSDRSSNRKGKVVVNDNYVAAWPGEGGFVYQFDHESVNNMLPEAKVFRGLDGAEDVLLYAFGSQVGVLKDFTRQSEEAGGKWTVEKHKDKDNHTVYSLKGFHLWSPSSDHEQRVYTLDPDKGFLVTHQIEYYPNGSIRYERDISLKHVDQYDIWIPHIIVKRRYEKGDVDSYGKLKNAMTIIIKQLELGKNVPDVLFTLDGLGINGYITVVRRTLTGEKVYIKKYIGGVYIPSDLDNYFQDKVILQTTPEDQKETDLIL